MTFYVYGDYGYANETTLHSCDTLQEAVQWAKDFEEDTYGTLGSFNVVEVANHNAHTGEYVTFYTVRAEDDHDDEPDSFGFSDHMEHDFTGVY